MTAEIVRMTAHKNGRKVPIAPLITSASSLTAMVQVSLTRIGTIKSSTPMADGMMKSSFSLVSFFIEPVLFSKGILATLSY